MNILHQHDSNIPRPICMDIWVDGRNMARRQYPSAPLVAEGKTISLLILINSVAADYLMTYPSLCENITLCVSADTYINYKKQRSLHLYWRQSNSSKTMV